MAPHLVKAEGAYKDIRIHSFHHTHTHTHIPRHARTHPDKHSHAHTQTHTHYSSFMIVMSGYFNLRSVCNDQCQSHRRAPAGYDKNGEYFGHYK